jgi:hypothetical protein
MIQYIISILAIQEHTAWNKELQNFELASIERHCNKWGYSVTISKLQIIIIDKQLFACHCKTKVCMDGQIMKCRFQVSNEQYVTFLAEYGITHSGNRSIYLIDPNNNEDHILQQKSSIQDQIKSNLKDALKTDDVMYTFGDLQDAPDNSNFFHYGNCRIPKHPLGIVKACEELACSINRHIDSMDKAIISRHGIKGR